MKRGLLFPSLLLCASSSLPPITLKQLPTKERIYVDHLGRQRVFHGTNIVVKGPPWYPSRDGFDYQTSLVKEDFELMREAGMNTIRLAIMWPGAEQVRGTYNETYFAEIKAIIDEAEQYGIYTFGDMHQDAISERFCGEGVPAWAASTKGALLSFPEPILGAFTNGADGFPTRQDCKRLDEKLQMNGQGGYATEQAEMAIENLYENVDGLGDAWGLFLAKFATIVKGSTSVLGINLINEPFAGEAWHNPFRMLPKVANKKLQKAYDVVAGHIREVDENMLLMFPGVPWSDLHGWEKNDGFTAPPGGAKYADRSVLTFHYYEPPQEPDGEEYYIKKIMLPNARRLQTGIYLTETWGGPWAKSAPVAESLGISWSYWEWKDFCKESPESLAGTSQWAAFGSCKTGYGGQVFNASGIIPEKHRELGRMYAYAVQGVLTSHAFNAATTELAFAFNLDPAIQGPTEVYANAQWHGGAAKQFTVSVSPSDALTVEVRAAERSIHLKATNAAKAGPVSVTIVPARAASELVV